MGLRRILRQEGVVEADRDLIVKALMSVPPGGPGSAARAGAPRSVGDVEEAGSEDGDAARRTFTAGELAILDHADRVTVASGSVTGADRVPLGDTGLDDRGIHDVCAIAAYYAFVNGVANGLGVELEADGSRRPDPRRFSPPRRASTVAAPTPRQAAPAPPWLRLRGPTPPRRPCP